MKNIYFLGLGIILLGLVGCGSTKTGDDGRDLDGDLVAGGGESGDKKKRGLRRLRKDEEPAPRIEDELADDPIAETEEPPLPNDEEQEDEVESLESSAAKALEDAKLHYELGDYDFAAEELRRIGKNSPYYAEAQRMLLLLR